MLYLGLHHSHLSALLLGDDVWVPESRGRRTLPMFLKIHEEVHQAHTK